MASPLIPSKKRASPEEDEAPASKRRKTPSCNTPSTSDELAPIESRGLSIATADGIARDGLRRSIALVLDRVGFDSASEDALESFASMVETCMDSYSTELITLPCRTLLLILTSLLDLTSIIEDVKTFTHSARRTHPIPTDFETSLKRFNLTPSALRPHLKPPVPRRKRVASWSALPIPDDACLTLPVLGDDLSGAPDKESKQYIPKSFPSFPSLHTYKYTPQDADSVTASSDWALFDPSGQTASSSPGAAKKKQTRPLAPDEIPRGDPKKMREAATKEAKAGEEALRRLMRASKIAKQKELRTTAQREPARRERHGLWEAAMWELIGEEARVSGRQIDPGATHGPKGRFEIADHSMVVNSEGRHLRKEVARVAGRKTAAPGEVGVSRS